MKSIHHVLHVMIAREEVLWEDMREECAAVLEEVEHLLVLLRILADADHLRVAFRPAGSRGVVLDPGDLLAREAVHHLDDLLPLLRDQVLRERLDRGLEDVRVQPPRDEVELRVLSGCPVQRRRGTAQLQDV